MLFGFGCFGEQGWIFHLWILVITALGIWSYLLISTVWGFLFVCYFSRFKYCKNISISKSLVKYDLKTKKCFQKLPNFNHYINFMQSKWVLFSMPLRENKSKRIYSKMLTVWSPAGRITEQWGKTGAFLKAALSNYRTFNTKMQNSLSYCHQAKITNSDFNKALHIYHVPEISTHFF